MIFRHWSKITRRIWKYPNFNPAEIACRHCGELLHDSESMDLLQALRSSMDVPFQINSAYRCPIHNARIGGAPLSMHKFGRAFDIALTDHVDREKLIKCALQVGAGGIGENYKTFVHVDTGRRRSW